LTARIGIMAEKANVLFVDDEARVLDGFRRVLREKRADWRLFFAHSGRQALELLVSHPIDVLVCDMRMPEMDGGEVLAFAREHHPEACRICLSGHSEKEAMLKASSVAHLYLSKPCTREMLLSTIERNIGLKSLLPDRGLRAAASRVDFLPPLPQVMAGIMSELASEAPRLDRVADLIHRDPALTVKVLQLANSEYFGIAREVADARQAAELLGLDVLSPILSMVLEKNPAGNRGREPRMFEYLHRHSVAVAEAAARIARREGGSDALVDRTRSLGLVHDVGKLVLALHAPDDYRFVLDVSRKQNIPVSVVERDVFAGTHQEAGAFFLGLWGLPAEMIEAASGHHFPMKPGQDGFSPLAAVHVADCLVRLDEHSPGSAEESLDMDFLCRMNLDARLPLWREDCRAATRELPHGT